MRRYAQLHPTGMTQPDPEGSLIGAVSVLSFASANDVDDYLATADYVALEADEATFIGLARSECWTGLKYSVINRLPPELATRG